MTSLQPFFRYNDGNRCDFPHWEVPALGSFELSLPFPITICPYNLFPTLSKTPFLGSQDSSGSNGPMLRGGEDTCVVLHDAATMETTMVLYLLVIRLVVKQSYAGKSAGILGILCAKKNHKNQLGSASYMKCQQKKKYSVKPVDTQVEQDWLAG